MWYTRTTNHPETTKTNQVSVRFDNQNFADASSFCFRCAQDPRTSIYPATGSESIGAKNCYKTTTTTKKHSTNNLHELGALSDRVHSNRLSCLLILLARLVASAPEYNLHTNANKHQRVVQYSSRELQTQQHYQYVLPTVNNYQTVNNYRLHQHHSSLSPIGCGQTFP